MEGATPEAPAEGDPDLAFRSPRKLAIGILVAGLLLLFGLAACQPITDPSARASPDQTLATNPPVVAGLALPDLDLAYYFSGISRQTSLHTDIPERPQLEITNYTVDLGDSVFAIALRNEIKPETLLWANYDQLNDNPDLVSVGMELKVPPVDGVY